MSDRRPPRPVTDDDLRDPHIEALWRAGSREEPPAALDARLMAAAHREVRSAPRPADSKVAEATRPERWWWPLAAAATIGAVAFGVIQLQPLETHDRAAAVSDMSPPPALRRNEAAKPAQAAPQVAANQQQETSSLNDREAAKRMPSEPQAFRAEERRAATPSPAAPHAESGNKPKASVEVGNKPAASGDTATAGAALRAKTETKSAAQETNAGTVARSPTAAPSAPAIAGATSAPAIAGTTSGARAAPVPFPSSSVPAAAPPMFAPDAPAQPSVADEKKQSALAPSVAEAPAGHVSGGAARADETTAAPRREMAPGAAQKLDAPLSAAARNNMEAKREGERDAAAYAGRQREGAVDTRQSMAPREDTKQSLSPGKATAPGMAAKAAQPMPFAKDKAPSMQADPDRVQPSLAKAREAGGNDRLESGRAALPVPEWIALIRRLRDEGRTEAAVKELAAFRTAHRDDADRLLPADLRDWKAPGR